MLDIGLVPAPQDDLPVFSNSDWQVTTDGLEHRATGYFIASTSLAASRQDGLWEWPLQIGEKSWCNPRLFREAFLCALDHFGIAPDDRLTLSFAIGLGAHARSSGISDGFVALGEIVKPKCSKRKRPAHMEHRVPVPSLRPQREREPMRAEA